VAAANATSEPVPELVCRAGHGARFAYDEFFFGRLRNVYTRRNYRQAVNRFLGWCQSGGLELRRIMPKDVGHYLDSLDYAPATKKIHLAGLRHFFDELVVRHVVVLNPAASVRGERYQVVEGKTPEIPIEEARKLLWAIDTTHVVGLRDLAIVGILIYTAARVGAVARLRQADFFELGGQYSLRFLEKNGKSREIPVRHDLQRHVLDYQRRAGLLKAKGDTPLFRTAVGRTKRLTEFGMTANDMGRMVKRRMRNAGLSPRLSPHSFRVATITDLLQQGLPLGDVQFLAGHADPRTTRLYDRRQKRVTRNIVERISV
jgi:site-specific recombinase XerD